MHITAKREQLASAFATVATVANARSPKAILQNVKIVVAGVQTVTLMATDMECGVRTNLGPDDGVEINKRGEALLPVARFGQILRESQSDWIDIRTEGTEVIVEVGMAKFRLPSSRPDEYPNVSTFDSDRYHQVSARSLREMIRRTSFATDNESSRYALGGVLFEFAADHIIAIATDGRRAATMQSTATQVGEHQPALKHTIVPVKSLALISKAIADHPDDEPIWFAASSNDIRIATGKSTIYSRLVDGRYPNWEGAFPKRKTPTLVDLSVGQFFGAIRQAKIVADVETHGLDFEFGQHELVISTKTADLGQSRVSMPIEHEGSITVKLDHRYLTDFLRQLDPESVCTANIASSSEAVLLTTDDGYQYVIMPMALER